jgi:hypothetical protein
MQSGLSQMNIPHMGHMNSHAMLDNIKSMLITMAMVKGTTQTDSGGSSLFNTILIMLVVSFIDTIVSQIKIIFSALSSKFEHYISKNTKNLSIINKLTTPSANIKKSSIIVKIESGIKNPTSDAIIDLLTHLPHTKCILFSNGIYTINYGDEIEISKNIYAQLINSSTPKMQTDKPPQTHSGPDVTNETSLTTTNPSNITSVSTSLDEKGGGSSGYIDIYSYTLDMTTLRKEINDIVKDYLIKMTNKLGNDIYYFSELPLIHYRDASGKIDTSKSPECLHFRMKQFVTNRSFQNLFGKDIDIIRKRVEFFRDNKEWYDNKGVPYTLGILVSGNPGSGKTSIIKCISNELRRHIINVHLSDTMTKTQLENLFYSDQLHVTQNGKTDIYTIPINKRIYVLEDVDCQCDVILDRGNETAEQILAKKNEQLKKEVEDLKFAISEMANGRKMVMTGGGKLPEIEKKSEINQQKITLSFLLNLFDGVLETPGRITFMTTNFLDKLDKAFTRPGRIDVIRKFGVADPSQLIAIIEHRYDTKLTEEQINFIHNMPPCITPAEISRILFENFDSLNGALDSLSNYAKECMIQTKLKNDKKQAIHMHVAELENNVDTTPLNNDKLDLGEYTQPPFNFQTPLPIKQQMLDLNNPPPVDKQAKQLLNYQNYREPIKTQHPTPQTIYQNMVQTTYQNMAQTAHETNAGKDSPLQDLLSYNLHDNDNYSLYESQPTPHKNNENYINVYRPDYQQSSIVPDYQQSRLKPK